MVIIHLHLLWSQYNRVNWKIHLVGFPDLHGFIIPPTFFLNIWLWWTKRTTPTIFLQKFSLAQNQMITCNNKRDLSLALVFPFSSDIQKETLISQEIIWLKNGVVASSWEVQNVDSNVISQMKFNLIISCTGYLYANSYK